MSRTRSPMTSRSNWAKESSTFSVSRPMLDVVLKDWVTETKETLMLVEQLDELGEVGKRAGEPVDLVDDDDVDPVGPDLVQQALQGRAIERSAGEAAVIEPVANEPPALMRLALDVGLTGLPLGIERVEGEVEIMLGRFAGVDRAALRLWR